MRRIFIFRTTLEESLRLLVKNTDHICQLTH
ncbi:Uncharacterised protein [Vibrio cholerae]|nr:Uncharacterised protein [Vibrio cholerae]